MSSVTVKCPTCDNTIELDTQNSPEFCPFCGTGIQKNTTLPPKKKSSSAEKIDVIDKDITSDAKITADKLLAEADNYFNSSAYDSAYTVYDHVVDIDGKNIIATLRRELCRLYMFKNTDSVYPASTAFFQSVLQIIDKANFLIISDVVKTQLKTQICQDLYHFLSIKYSEEREFVKTRHSKKYIRQMLANLSRLVDYCEITCGIIAMEEIGNKRQTALTAVKALSLGIEMCNYVSSNFQYIGEPEPQIVITGSKRITKYIRKSYSIQLEPDERRKIALQISSFQKLKKEIYTKGDSKIINEINHFEEEFEKTKKAEAARILAKKREKQEWRQKNESMLSKSEKDYKTIKIIGISFMLLAIISILFYMYNFLALDLRQSYALFFASVLTLTGLVCVFLWSKNAKQIKFYQGVIDAENEKIDYVDDNIV